MDEESGPESDVKSDLSRLVAAAERLTFESRSARWAHLSLCLLDAVFSINATYTSTRKVPARYADEVGLDVCLLPAASFPRRRPGEQPLSAFVADAQRWGDEAFASEVLRNRQRTSARSAAPRKAQAARQMAEVLVAHGLETLGDVEDHLADLPALALVESDLATIPGHGIDGLRVGYLWMLAGDDQRLKPDRMILRWLQDQLQRGVKATEAVVLVRGVAARLGRTPWELDQAIWRAQRNVSKAPSLKDYGDCSQ